MSKRSFKKAIAQKKVIAVLNKVLNKGKADEVKLYNIFAPV